MLESIRQQTLDVLTTLIAHLPNVLGGLLLVLAGWLLARFLRMVITRLIQTLNRFLDRQFHRAGGALARGGWTIRQRGRAGAGGDHARAGPAGDHHPPLVPGHV